MTQYICVRNTFFVSSSCLDTTSGFIDLPSDVVHTDEEDTKDSRAMVYIVRGKFFLKKTEDFLLWQCEAKLLS